MLVLLADFLLTIVAVLLIPLILLALLAVFFTAVFADALDYAYLDGLRNGAKLLRGWVQKRNFTRKNRVVTFAVCTGLWGTASATFFGILLPIAVLLVAPNDYNAATALVVGMVLGLFVGGAYGAHTYVSGALNGNHNA